ncbi:unnamed protein product [Amoebophrya sp. A120]|nr:unnamed protein product [Amoebophrya sp. A120]|eukprot:GSA120T00019024001.1
MFQIPVDHPRHRDGMTPLCIACLRGCLPLSIILLEDYHASCNVITKHNLVPYQLNLQPQPSDDALATEGRQLLKNRFECFRVGKDAQEVLRKLRQAPAPVIEHKVWAGSTDF